ncbi:hypothetical protein FA15DRAFT_672815 [Coprinopsis marcescibilis]|uniref:DUF6533 domain-containing protein n=1 Tax=Coprinopsis marcescibilis TaxID=230819 RepID=A0A5C3KZ46_COPMA|nr:hypothetical protein FA15DRAFT_672815 [Coprinopsis marcescibilis]
MSPDAQPGAEMDPVKQSVVYQTQYVVAVSLTILLYDYALTFCNEVNWIWRGPSRTSLTTILFFINRYFSLLVTPVLVAQYFWESSDSSRLPVECRTLTTFHYIAIFFSQSVMGVILVMRTHALYGKPRWILLLFGIIALAVVAAGVWGLVTAPKLAFSDSPIPPRGYYMPGIIMVMAGEMLIFAMTLYKSVQITKREKPIVLRILLRDGRVIMVAYIGLLVSYYDYSRGNIATLVNSLYATLVSRLILNLRDPSLSSDARFMGQNETRTSDITTSVMVGTGGSVSLADSSYFYPSRGSDDISLNSLKLQSNARGGDYV